MVVFSQGVFDTICDRIANGESLRKICLDDDMPCTASVKKWLAKDEGGKLVAQYARARSDQAETLVDECLAIADQYDSSAENLGETDHIQRAKLRIDTRKWMAGKLKPKKYGEKLDHTSSDGSMTPSKTIDVSGLSTEALRELAGLDVDNGSHQGGEG